MDDASIWGAAGLLLVIADVIFGTFFMLFLGGGALITALLVLAGLNEPTLQWLSFAVISLLGVVLFRKKLISAFGSKKNDRYVEHEGQQVKVVEAITQDGTGRVLYRGSEWPARSRNGSPIAADTMAVICNTDGILLTVEPAS